MTILAFDAAGDALSVALRNHEGCRYFEVDAGLRHSERLMEITDAVLASARVGPADLDLVACMAGPGSFTGLRIGFSTAKGMAAALGIPLVAVPTLDCIAFSLSHWPGIVVPVIDAKKGRYYCALYSGGTKIVGEMDASVEEIIAAAGDSAPLILTGPGAPAALRDLAPGMCPGRLHVDPNHRSGHARELTLLAAAKYGRDGHGEPDDAGPAYLRKSDAELVKEASDGRSV